MKLFSFLECKRSAVPRHERSEQMRHGKRKVAVSMMLRRP